MPIGFGGGQSFGLEAKVQAAVDRQSKRQLTKDVEDAIGKAEGVSPGMRGRTMGGVTGRGRGGLGGATAAGAGASGGLLSRLGGAAGGATAMLGTVALGGVVATKMLQSMTEASGQLRAVRDIQGEAMSLFWKPFGDKLGEGLQPLSEDLLDMAIQFNKLAEEDGLAVAVASMPRLLVDQDNLVGGAIQASQLIDLTTPIPATGLLSGSIAASAIITGDADIDEFLFGNVDIGGFLSGEVDIGEFIFGKINIREFLFGGRDGGGDDTSETSSGSGGSSGPASGREGRRSFRESDPSLSGTDAPPIETGPRMEGVDLRRIGGDPAGRQTSVELNLNDERVGKLTVREQANLLRRL